MGRTIVVAGVVSFYMTLGVRELPPPYASISTPRWSAAGVSGAAGHIARVLRTLGDDVRLCSVVGRDLFGAVIRDELGGLGLYGPGVVESERSSAGVVLAGPGGRRMGFPCLEPVNGVRYPPATFEAQARKADLLVLTNAKFVRELVPRAAGLGVPIAVDAHLISDLGDPYNRPWLEAATIVFCSHERLPCRPDDWAFGLLRRYPRCAVVGVGLGAEGALVAMRDGRRIRVDAVTPRTVINTAGAGDAMFATFLHYMCDDGDPVRAARYAVTHAGWKIGDRAPVTVSLTREELSALVAAHGPYVAVDGDSPVTES
ncbi:carbohydrate kinase family protein [Sphaerisporangium sp. B11E5]|uniref:carbohydrate kinase family protein n=1 Tax=Sphaerisporangium sp. B11E5 TaxID=3153563 RepID=UPI00325F128F